jgi:hypothetical protein
MTLLDVAVLLFLMLLGAGGYRQGCIGCGIRLTAFTLIGVVTALLLVLMPAQDGLQLIVIRTLALLLGVSLLVGVVTWFALRAAPPPLQHSRWNRILGIIPALLQGLLILTLALGLAHQLTFESSIQYYLERGVVTGSLIQAFEWLEQSVVGGVG